MDFRPRVKAILNIIVQVKFSFLQCFQKGVFQILVVFVVLWLDVPACMSSEWQILKNERRNFSKFDI